jgi:hypothetical protein
MVVCKSMSRTRDLGSIAIAWAGIRLLLKWLGMAGSWKELPLSLIYFSRGVPSRHVKHRARAMRSLLVYAWFYTCTYKDCTISLCYLKLQRVWRSQEARPFLYSSWQGFHMAIGAINWRNACSAETCPNTTIQAG